MGGNRTKQAAFAWTPSAATPPEASVGQELRPEAPPTVRGGGARGAALGRVGRVERVRSPVAPSDELPPDNELWDVHAAARFLKRSVSWVYHKAEDGTLPVKRLGGWGIRFIPGELRAWVASDQASGRSRR